MLPDGYLPASLHQGTLAYMGLTCVGVSVAS
jgi:hypothetical protein